MVEKLPFYQFKSAEFLLALMGRSRTNALLIDRQTMGNIANTESYKNDCALNNSILCS